MKYLCLAFLDAETYGHMHLDYDETFRGSGRVIVAEALQAAEASTVVRVRQGRMSITDGPFVETKEQLGGFLLIEARDLNEAILVASRIPSARLGSVEVRPIRELGLA
ncbi:MAG TPA: YciI family protein [Gemmatimonadales bacterium]|jgi:hypothetical protein|nr:YciI family protein [Gemmatimonadales bacterium]